jgi:Cu/Ag efflux pump CusA
MFTSAMLRMSSGVIVWAVHFAVIYGVTALACARGNARLVPWVIGLATLFGIAFTAAIIVRSYPRRDDFAHWMAAAVAGIAMLAMVWEALAALVVRMCG